MSRLIVLEAKAPPQPAPKPPPPKPQSIPKPQPEAQAQPKPDAPPKPDPEIAIRKKAEEEAARKAAERARAEAERQQRLAALAEQAESDLEQAILDESQTLQTGTEEMVAQSYQMGIYDLVRRNWSRPPSARNGMQARLLVELIPTGEVVSVTVTEGSGNAAFDRSAEQAVRRVGKFEVPKENAIFERYFRSFYFLFQPEDLLR
jgi:colicin import membrane protein